MRSIDSFTEISLAARNAGKTGAIHRPHDPPRHRHPHQPGYCPGVSGGGPAGHQRSADVGTVGHLLQYTRQLALPITSISNSLDQLLAALSAAERVFNVMDERPLPSRTPLPPSLWPPIQGPCDVQRT